MKKTLIALGVTAALAGIAQAAENSTTLYGSLGYETQLKQKNHDNDNDKTWDLETATAKLGVKGTEVLNNGLEAFYKFEFGFDTTGKKSEGLNKTKKAYIGVKGGFGTLTLGNQSSLYGDVTEYNDIYQDNWFDDRNHYDSGLKKAIKYESPNFSGFQAGVAAVLDGSHEVIKGDEDDFNAAQAGLWYDQNGFYTGLAYAWTDEKKGTHELWGAALGYSNDQFQVGLGAEHAASLGEKYNLAGEYSQGANTFRASVGMADDDEIDPKENIYTYGLGYQYNFSKRTYSWVEGQYTDGYDDDDENGYIVSVGLRHDF